MPEGVGALDRRHQVARQDDPAHQLGDRAARRGVGIGLGGEQPAPVAGRARTGVGRGGGVGVLAPLAGRLGLEEQRLALALLSDLQIADVTQLAKAGTDGKRQALSQLLERQRAGMPQLSEAIAKRYFNLVEKGARWVRARSRVDT